MVLPKEHVLAVPCVNMMGNAQVAFTKLFVNSSIKLENRTNTDIFILNV